MTIHDIEANMSVCQSFRLTLFQYFFWFLHYSINKLSRLEIENRSTPLTRPVAHTSPLPMDITAMFLSLFRPMVLPNRVFSQWRALNYVVQLQLLTGMMFLLYDRSISDFNHMSGQRSLYTSRILYCTFFSSSGQELFRDSNCFFTDCYLVLLSEELLSLQLGRHLLLYGSLMPFIWSVPSQTNLLRSSSIILSRHW